MVRVSLKSTVFSVLILHFNAKDIKEVSAPVIFEISEVRLLQILKKAFSLLQARFLNLPLKKLLIPESSK